MPIRTQHHLPPKEGGFTPAKGGPASKPDNRLKEDARDGLQLDADTEAFVGGLDEAGTSLGTPGKALDQDTRQYFESRFLHDFSKVKVHDDTQAARSAVSLGASAYTIGNHIVFNKGQYLPGTRSGDRLLAHELTHVVQQSHTPRPRQIQRSTVMVNDQEVQIDFGNIIRTTDYLAGLQSEIGRFTGATPAAATHSPTTERLRRLTRDKQRWLLFALDVLIENTNEAFSSFNRVDAVDRLILFAPGANTEPLSTGIRDMQAFASEVLLNSGWTEVAVARGLAAPGAAARQTIDNIVNPPSAESQATTEHSAREHDTQRHAGRRIGVDNFQEEIFRTRLDRGLRRYLQHNDTAHVTNLGTQSLGDIQAIGDMILSEARIFFHPFADAVRGNILNRHPAWAASSGLSATTSHTPGLEDRIDYLYNRAQLVGRNATATDELPDTNIFAATHYNASIRHHARLLNSIISAIASDPAFRSMIDGMIRHTPFNNREGSEARIRIDVQFNADTYSACEARWRSIRFLCHEMLHALAYPNFRTASRPINFRQVIEEGFTEVLGNQLFNQRVLPQAASDAAFRARLEQGLPTPTCPLQTAAPISYGSAGAGAETIRATAGDNNFRAAYFLGRTDLVGL